MIQGTKCCCLSFLIHNWSIKHFLLKSFHIFVQNSKRLSNSHFSLTHILNFVKTEKKSSCQPYAYFSQRLSGITCRKNYLMDFKQCSYSKLNEQLSSWFVRYLVHKCNYDKNRHHPQILYRSNEENTNYMISISNASLERYFNFCFIQIS